MIYISLGAILQLLKKAFLIAHGVCKFSLDCTHSVYGFLLDRTQPTYS